MSRDVGTEVVRFQWVSQMASQTEIGMSDEWPTFCHARSYSCRQLAHVRSHAITFNYCSPWIQPIYDWSLVVVLCHSSVFYLFFYLFFLLVVFCIYLFHCSLPLYLNTPKFNDLLITSPYQIIVFYSFESACASKGFWLLPLTQIYQYKKFMKNS